MITGATIVTITAVLAVVALALLFWLVSRRY